MHKAKQFSTETLIKYTTTFTRPSILQSIRIQRQQRIYLGWVSFTASSAQSGLRASIVYLLTVRVVLTNEGR